MREYPVDHVVEARRALAGVCDLLNFGWRPEAADRDMYGVDCEALFWMLALIREKLDRAIALHENAA